MPRKKSGIPKQTVPKGPIVALHLPEDPHELYTHCLASWGAIKADTVHFVTPPLPAAEVDGDLTALNLSLQAAESGTPAAIAALGVAAEKVRQDFQVLGKYVQGVLRSGAIEDAAAILSNILMYVSNVGKRKPKPPFAVTRGPASGSARVAALAVLSALTYGWEWSVDQQTWTVTTTGHASAVLTGLTPGKTYYFRFRAFRRDGTMTDYSQTLTWIVT